MIEQNSWHVSDIEYKTLYSKFQSIPEFRLVDKYLQYISINLFIEIREFFKSENLREGINNESTDNI